MNKQWEEARRQAGENQARMSDLSPEEIARRKYRLTVRRGIAICGSLAVIAVILAVIVVSRETHPAWKKEVFAAKTDSELFSFVDRYDREFWEVVTEMSRLRANGMHVAYLELEPAAIDVVENLSYCAGRFLVKHPDSEYYPSVDAKMGAVMILTRWTDSEIREMYEPLIPREKTVSPRHPYYLIYMRADGSVAVGCANMLRTLAAFQAAAVGKTEPILALCDAFDRQTEHGEKMGFYDGLLNAAVADIIQKFAASQFAGLLSPSDKDFMLTSETNAPKGVDDFELITWLVIMEDDKA